MRSVLLKQIMLLPDYVKLVIKEQTEYKFAFYLYILAHLIPSLLWLVFWDAVFKNVTAFGGWSFPLVALLTGFVTISSSFSYMFWAIYQLPAQVVTGKLNTFLTKPVHPFLHIVLKELNIYSITSMILGILIIGYVLVVYSLPYSFVTLLIAGVMTVFGYLAGILPLCMICCLSFWIGRADFVRDLFVEIYSFEQYPLTEYPKVIAYFFTFAIPLIFAGTFPALVLTVFTLQQSLLVLGLVVCIVAAQLVLFDIIWKKGLKRYDSYGG